MSEPTRCPECNADTIYVVSGSFRAKGVRLYDDGFDLSEAKQIETEDEEAWCKTCDHRAPLYEFLPGDEETED